MCLNAKWFYHGRLSRDGNTLAHMAAQKGSVEVLKTMFEIDKALVTSAKNRFNENSPLHLATEGGHLEAVRLMLDNGVSASDENKFGFTPVHLAAKCGHADVFDVFAKSGVSLRHPSSKIGMTALHIASYYGEEEIARDVQKWEWERSVLPCKAVSFWGLAFIY
jgi:ankyrin repeat protein